MKGILCYYTVIFQVFTLHHLQSQRRNVEVQAERVWNALQQHAIEASERKNAAVKKNNNQIPPDLFADGKNGSKSTPAPSAIVVRLYSKNDEIRTVGDTSARQGKAGMMMMSKSGAVMKTAPPSPSIAPSTTTFSPSEDAKSKGGVMSKKTLTPSSSVAPSASIQPSDGKIKGGGGMMMMSQPTQSPSVSFAPSTSLFPTDSKGKGGMMMSKSKETFSPTSSVAPSISLVPTQDKGMSKKFPPPKDKTPPPTSSLVPSSTPAPTKKMKLPKTKAPTPSPAPSDSNQPTVKGGMMMNMKDGMSMMNPKKGGSDPPAVLPETLSPSPAVAPVPTPSGVIMNIVRLTPYSLRYAFNQSRVPQTFEVTEVVVVTQMYLAEFFESRLADIMEFRTISTGSAFALMQPFLLNYSSTAIFETTAKDPIPAVAELDLLLKSAFTGQNLGTYIDLLQELPPENSFRTTSNVSFTAVPTDKKGKGRTDDNSQDANGGSGKGNGSSSAKRTGGIVAGASVFLLLIVSVGIHYQKSKRDAPPTRRIGILPKQDPDSDEAHMTVAGDTYMAESTVVSGGVLSLLSSRRRRRGKDRKELNQRDSPVRAGTPVVSADEMQSLTLPSIASRPEWQRRSSSESGSEEDSDIAIYDTDRLRHFHIDPPAYRGALSTDAHLRMSRDVLAVRDDMRLPRHFVPIDDIPNDASIEGDDNDSLSVDEDVPMRVIDLIRKFTPSRRCASR